MRRLLATAGGLAVAAAYFMLSALPALSADSGTVNAQVTVQGACITLDKTSLDFGLLSFSQPGAQVQVSGGVVTVTNCGAAATLFGRGTNAKSAAGLAGPGITWILDDNTTPICTLGVNRYGYYVGPAGVPLSTADKQIATLSVPPLPALQISNHLIMPCAGSDGSGQTMSWDIVYTATL